MIYKIVLVVICSAVILVGSFAFRLQQYHNGFSQIEIGQSKQTAVNLMGKTSEIRNCNFPIYNENRQYIKYCFELHFYQGFYEQWALAFDKDGNVTEKYYWYFGEYGKRPPVEY